MIFDLHSHTLASDGLLAPTDLIKRAITQKVDVLAITDHDTVKGAVEASQLIMNEKLPIMLVNGVEISTLWKHTEIHIVGLNIDTGSKALTQLLLGQQHYRIDRAKAIASKLEKVNIYDAYDKAQHYAQGDSVSRAHFARLLIDSGVVKDMKRAFKTYLGKSGYAYVPPAWCSVEQAVVTIHEANGQAVLAHPSRYDLTLSKLKLLISEFKQCGGDAMEVSQSRQTTDDLKTLAKLANEYGLLASQGSDFHGSDSYLELGKTSPLPVSVTPIWHDWSF